ncbi:hypothetical protein V5O48_014147 [Marasmius crinis-equi]|uniref:BZIP domain-containing protein n=1 Tax=Marasmius crinis-equi TaxID=585013 RepID=A0ABR3EY49_9AGAR
MNPSPAYSYTSLDSFDSSPTTSDFMELNHTYYQMPSNITANETSQVEGSPNMPMLGTMDPTYMGSENTSSPITSTANTSFPSTSQPSPKGVGRARRSPDNLLGLDAPVQPRHYTTPSATSRKEIPSFYLKRRPQLQIPEDEDDELTEELPSNATDQEKIEFRRHRNTLAARRSRRRKQAYQQDLEESVERLKIERQKWKTRAETLRQLIRSQGIACPEWSE